MHFLKNQIFDIYKTTFKDFNFFCYKNFLKLGRERLNCLFMIIIAIFYMPK